MKLLLVDDEESTRELLRLSLEYEGYEVLTAADGRSGLKIFAEERPDIVLTDIKMPGMDGIEVLRRIKGENRDAEVIVITGHGEMSLAIEALQLEASDFITKPISDAALAVALRRAREKIWMRTKLREYTENLERLIHETTQELKKRHEFEHNLIQTSMDGIIANDRQGRIIIFNEGAEHIYGYTREEVLSGMHVSQLYTKGKARVIKKMIYGPEYGGPGRLINYEVEVRTKSGETAPILLSATLLYDEGQEVATVGYFKDMREVKRLETELIQSARLAAMGQAMAGVAHGVKNILHGMKLGAFLVDKGLKDNKLDLLSKGWGLVGRNINRISRLTLDMLSYARSGPPTRQSCSVNQIAEEVCELMEGKARERRVTLIRDLDPSIPPMAVDPEGIHTCLLNLVTNAIEAFSETGGGREIIVGSRRQGDADIRLQVVDTGRGMTKELQEQIFKQFYSTKGSRGTGLGLAITQKIIHEHGGTIQVESEPGKGSCFTILLPLGGPPTFRP